MSDLSKRVPRNWWFSGSYAVWRFWRVSATTEDRSGDFLPPPPRIEDPKPFMTPAADSVMRTYWGNGIPLCTRPVSRAFTRKLKDRELLEDPFDLVLDARVEAAKKSGILPVDIYAVPSANWQGWAMLGLDPTWTEIVYVASGQIGLVLGRRWVPFPRDLGGRFSKFDTQRMRRVEQALDVALARIKQPHDPAGEAARLLDSIPGIGSELPDDPPDPDTDSERSN